MANIKTLASIKIHLGSVETLKLHIDAPNATLHMNLRSLHDNSFVNCKNVSITTFENNQSVRVYDQKNSKFEL